MEAFPASCREAYLMSDEGSKEVSKHETRNKRPEVANSWFCQEGGRVDGQTEERSQGRVEELLTSN